ncbi:Probable BOI-related E3 ubiquitin-protein ligase 3 [Linum grandiflorum]
MAIQAQFPASFSAAAQDFAAENCFVNNNNNNNNNNNGGVGGFNFFNTLEQQQQKKQHQFFQQQQLVLQQQRNTNTNNNNNNNVFAGNGNFVFETLNRSSSNINGVVLASPNVKPEVKSAAAMQSVNPSLQSIAAFEQKQRQELDHYIRLQNERLRLMLQEQRKQQLAVLLKSIESKATVLIQQKDDELSMATKRAAEMELIINRLEMENQAWQRIAKENEAAVISLNNTLEQVRESSSLMMMVNNGEEDADSCCSGNDDVTATGAAAGGVCKGCNSRGACVLFLPCRHLCSCNVCEGFLDSCPVCRTPKKASIEALMG